MDKSTPTKRGPYARTRIRRQQIADAVLSLVDEVGPEAVTTSQVAERAAIAEATVLYHYSSKDDLLVAALEKCDEMEAARNHVEDPQLRWDLVALLEGYGRPTTADPRFRLARMVRGMAAAPSSSAAAYLRQRTARQIQIFTRMFEQRKRDGVAHPDLDSAAAAQQVVALWDGLDTVFADEAEIDAGRLLADAIRRLSGENWMQMSRVLDDAGRRF